MTTVLVTPTRDRPEAFALCERYVRRQTEQNFHWLIIDDGDIPARLAEPGKDSHISHFRREPSEWRNTLPKNMLAALAHPLLEKPEGQLVLMIEDDEWYHPRYVETLVAALRTEGSGFVGQSNARYYHLLHRTFWCPNNQRHASLCRTAWVHGEREAEWFKAATEDAEMESDPFIDMRVWNRRTFRAPGAPPPMKLLKDHAWLSVGIKGMPGRAGLGSAHSGGVRGWTVDPQGIQLAEWTSIEDRDAYYAIMGHQKGAAPVVAKHMWAPRSRNRRKTS